MKGTTTVVAVLLVQVAELARTYLGHASVKCAVAAVPQLCTACFAQPSSPVLCARRSLFRRAGPGVEDGLLRMRGGSIRYRCGVEFLRQRPSDVSEASGLSCRLSCMLDTPLQKIPG